MNAVRPQLFVQRNGIEVLSPAYWNAWYANARRGQAPAKSAWGDPTRLMVEQIVRASGNLVDRSEETPRRKFVVDLGAGDGRYSVWAAKQGAIVDHVDSSKGACDALVEMALANEARVERLGGMHGNVTADGRTLHFDSGGMITICAVDASYYTRRLLAMTVDFPDVVFSSGLMEYLSPHKVATLIRRLQEKTAVGGVHAIVYLAQGPGVSEIPGEHPHVPGSIEELYGAGWRRTFTTDTGNPADEIRDDTHIILGRTDGIEALTIGAPVTHQHMIRRFVMVKEDPNRTTL
jgi:SAM-dependent methyltransferase